MSRGLKNTAAVVLAFFACWAGFFVVNLLALAGYIDEPHPARMAVVVGCFAGLAGWLSYKPSTPSK